MHPFVNTGIKAARKAGELILRAYDQVEQEDIIAKDTNDFVTAVDKQAENEIISQLRKAYPSHGILAEESGEHEGKDDYQWIIDPLDGTTNFIHRYPHFCISIALKHKNRIEHAIVYDPIKQDIYTASRGQGARKNERRIRVQPTVTIENALLTLTLPRFNHPNRETCLALLTSKLAPKARAVRIDGSAALDLAYVAAGQADGYLGFGLSPWDIAAGSLLVQEAGGICVDHKGQDSFLESGNILAAPLKLTGLLVKEVKA